MKTEKVQKPAHLTISDSVIFEGDALTVLRRIPSSSVQCVVTSPPYWGLRDYRIADERGIGLEPTLTQFMNRLVAVFAEVKRVLKSDGTLWLNIGDGYTSGNRGWRAPDKKNPARAMSIRPDTPNGLKPKDLLGLPWRLAFALQEDGWYLRTDIVWHKPNAMPESVRDRPTRAHEFLFLLAKSERYYFNYEAVMEPAGIRRRRQRSVWNVNTQPLPEAHFATFPQKLVEPCVLAGSRSGDFILDPFFGAGTVGVVCMEHARRYIGIEINPRFVQIAAERLVAANHQIIKVNAA
jgi:site-specific DNA-methyltransferase (adenine-specific)